MNNIYKGFFIETVVKVHIPSRGLYETTASAIEQVRQNWSGSSDEGILDRFYSNMRDWYGMSDDESEVSSIFEAFAIWATFTPASYDATVAKDLDEARMHGAEVKRYRPGTDLGAALSRAWAKAFDNESLAKQFHFSLAATGHDESRASADEVTALRGEIIRRGLAADYL